MKTYEVPFEVSSVSGKSELEVRAFSLLRDNFTGANGGKNSPEFAFKDGKAMLIYSLNEGEIEPNLAWTEAQINGVLYGRPGDENGIREKMKVVFMEDKKAA